DLAIYAAAVAAVGLLFMKLREGYNPFQTLVAMVRTAFVHTNQAGYMWSKVHFRDFFNEQILIGPLGMFLFVIAAVVALPKGEHRATAWFVLIAGIGYLVACWMIGDSNLGYARDWDLLSHSAIVFTVAALVLFFRQRMRHATAVAAMVCAIGVSAYHTVPWIATNADEERSLARLATLPLGMGRTEVVMSTWYRQRGETDKQRYWLQQAITRNPGNVNALYLLGALDYKLGRFEDAIPTLEKAVRIRPSKVEFRTLLAQSYYAVNRLAEAIPHLEMAAEGDPRNVTTLMTLGEAYTAVGRSAESLATFQRAEALLKPYVARKANDSQTNLFYGFALYRCNRFEESIGFLQKAVALDPNSKEGHCFLGYALRGAGRSEEAEVQFRTCLTINPAFPARGEIETWLTTRR
ncbi:MAG TPA: tetratricopeptide repeat protein, partial [Candidatus Krumholzibacteria bacterium]|nr:tetratricopeptide repeat protein [Candidatus Krumholzibacteria bacterium]